jgi:aminoglycoside 2'-N-acetyltransferase I
MNTAPTADLDPATLHAIRALMDEAFEGDFSDEDWDHALGGMHVLAWDGDELVGHGAVAQRRVMYEGRAWRCGYVEGVAVSARRRRHGLAGQIMETIERIVRAGYDLGALSTTDAGIPLYESRGWLRWRGPTSAITPRGVERTPGDDDSVFVLPVNVELDLDGEITCDWREGEVW